MSLENSIKKSNNIVKKIRIKSEVVELEIGKLKYFLYFYILFILINFFDRYDELCLKILRVE